MPGYTRTVGAYARSVPGAVEKKYFDSNIANSGDLSAGVVFNSCCLVPQGTTDVTRVGNKIMIKNINLKGTLTLDDQGTGSIPNGIIRIIVFIDKQANGATAAVTDILKTATFASFRNMDQVDRFTILKDKVYTIRCQSSNALHTGASAIYFAMSKKCNIPIHYSSTTGAITEIKSNNVGLLYIADGTQVNVASGASRVKFTDL